MKFVHLALLATMVVAESDTDKKVKKEKDNRKGTGCDKGIKFEYFENDDCSTKKNLPTKDTNVDEPSESDLKEMDDKCHKISGDKSFHTSCQAGQGIVLRHYDNANCAPLREKKTVVEWDKCSKVPS